MVDRGLIIGALALSALIPLLLVSALWGVGTTVVVSAVIGAMLVPDPPVQGAD